MSANEPTRMTTAPTRDTSDEVLQNLYILDTIAINTGEDLVNSNYKPFMGAGLHYASQNLRESIEKLFKEMGESSINP